MTPRPVSQLDCPEPAPYRDVTKTLLAAVEVLNAAVAFTESLTQIPYWREHSSEDAAALVAAVSKFESVWEEELSTDVADADSPAPGA